MHLMRADSFFNRRASSPPPPEEAALIKEFYNTGRISVMHLQKKQGFMIDGQTDGQADG